jgi:hypothetical protein
MGITPIQPITAFHKENNARTLAAELERKDTYNAVRRTLIIWMKPNNLVQQPEAIRPLISRLTGFNVQAISRALKRLVIEGFAEKLNEKTYRINPEWVNKTTFYIKEKIGYKGKTCMPTISISDKVGSIMSFAPKAYKPKHEIETNWSREKMLEDKIKGLEKSTGNLEQATLDLKAAMNANFKKILDMLNNGKVEESKRHLELVVDNESD